jgi:hypothetical protein
MSHLILNPKWEILKSQNEIDDKLNLNSEAMSHTKCTLLSTVINVHYLVPSYDPNNQSKMHISKKIT